MQVDGYSLDAQRDKLRKYAAYEDMVVAGEYSDEGFSGKNIQGRQEFQRMLNDIQDCKDGVSYVLVFKLSRFGRNAADVLNSLQLMQDFGVNLICVEDGIDSSKDAGKLMISVLSAVAEIERENIRTQTMAGREQKAREGKWNGGFAPYGYKLESGNLVIAEDGFMGWATGREAMRKSACLPNEANPSAAAPVSISLLFPPWRNTAKSRT